MSKPFFTVVMPAYGVKIPGKSSQKHYGTDIFGLGTVDC